MLEAQREEISAGQVAAQGFTAGAPVLGLAQRRDRRGTGNEPGSNAGRETELSLEAPLWRPGQRSARQALALAAGTDLDAQIAHARLSLAGEVRERLWEVVAVREALTEAQSHLEQLETLATEVTRRVAAGDLARTDAMAVQQEVLAARAELGLAQVRLQEQVLRYRNLTGQEPIATPVDEVAGSNPVVPHPRLQASRTGLQQAQAMLGLVQASRSEPWTLGVSLRSERDSGATAATRSVGLSVQIPLGSVERNRPQVAAASTRIAGAAAEVAQAQATLADEIALARLQLDQARESLALSAARTTLAREHAGLIDKAFRLGERPLAERLRAQAQVHEAHTHERQQQGGIGFGPCPIQSSFGDSSMNLHKNLFIF